MGFLQAVCSLGEMTAESYQDSPLADIMNFLQLPYPLPEEDEKGEVKGKVFAIRVWLDVVDPRAEVLDITGVAKIDRIEYPAIGTEIEIKERCLYRDPVGSNVSWRFSPLYKLGPGKKDPLKELLGETGNWQRDKDCRFYKLYHNLLQDYETSGFLATGSIGTIMASLMAKIDEIAEFWSDRRIPSFLLFGLKAGERFLYPGEVPVFVKYFREKLKPDGKATVAKKKSSRLTSYCALCGERGQKLETLDRVFKFATFDKPSFLPGIKPGAGVKEKVFPICEVCYSVLSAGKEEMEKRFVNFNILRKISLYVIPEIVTDRQEYLRMASDFTKDFLKNGIRHEEKLFNILAMQNEGLVYHFLFGEIHRAQLIIHSLVEDVPPTRLRQLEKLWTETCLAFGYEIGPEGKKHYLDTAIRQIIAVFLSLAGKRDQDRAVMRDKIIAVISGLLSGDVVGIEEIKTLMVSRLAGLFTDPDWLSPKGKEEMPGRLKMRGMAEVVDFLYRVNRRG